MNSPAMTPTLKKILGFGIIAIIAVAGISLYLIQKKSGSEGDRGIQASLPSIKVDHYFENGVHTYKGMITVPTPCHDILSTVTVMESYPEQVSIDLKREGASNFCAQVISQAPFEVTFQASNNARISATLDGKPIRLKATEKSDGTGESIVPVPVAPTTTETQIFDDSFLYEGSAVE